MNKITNTFLELREFNNIFFIRETWLENIINFKISPLIEIFYFACFEGFSRSFTLPNLKTFELLISYKLFFVVT